MVLESLNTFPEVMDGSGAFHVLGVCCQPSLLLPYGTEIPDPSLMEGPRDELSP